MDTHVLTEAQVLAAVGPRKGRKAQQAAIVATVVKYLPVYGPAIGIMKLHRLCDWLAQIGHESADFAYTKEIGGHTRRYAPWFGRGIIQLTWKTNYQAFTRWLWKDIDKIRGKTSPDYSTAAHRDKVGEDLEVAFLTAVFYWQWRRLNRYSDANDFRGLTKAINGGYNGWKDRVHLRGRFGLMLLGYQIKRGAYARFQADNGLPQTDRFDAATQRRMHELLKAAPPLNTKLSNRTMETDMIGKLTGFLKGSGPLGAVAGVLGALIGADFGTTSEAAKTVGDLKELDLGAILASLAALAAGTGAVVNSQGNKAAASPGDAACLTEMDKQVNLEALREVANRIYEGKPMDPDGNEKTYDDIVMTLLGRGLDTIDDGLAFGLEWGRHVCMQGLHDRGELPKLGGAKPKPS